VTTKSERLEVQRMIKAAPAAIFRVIGLPAGRARRAAALVVPQSLLQLP
jgi:hypothetical protein